MTQQRRQSAADARAEEARWYGDRRERPGKRLSADPLSDFELVRFRLRVRDSREVAHLGTVAELVAGAFRESAIEVVKAVDRINLFLSGILVQDSSGGYVPAGADFSGLTIGGLEAKRATLCVNSKRACRLVGEGRVETATATLKAAMDDCFPQEKTC